VAQETDVFATGERGRPRRPAEVARVRRGAVLSPASRSGSPGDGPTNAGGRTEGTEPFPRPGNKLFFPARIEVQRDDSTVEPTFLLPEDNDGSDEN